ncbi:hypothetical protein JXA40_01075 [bacterium]|nr:hypothetical protein [candidate division CSSED10-310 bacterium]
MNKLYILCILGLTLAVLLPVSASTGTHSLGLGLHYFYALGDIEDDLDGDIEDAFHRDGFAFNASYRYKPNRLFGYQIEIQALPSGYYDAEEAFSPRAFILLGHIVYAGVGVGWNYVTWESETASLHDYTDWSDPFFLIRGGLDLPFLLPRLRLDLNASYEVNQWNDIDYFDSDAITFGIGARINL